LYFSDVIHVENRDEDIDGRREEEEREGERRVDRRIDEKGV